MNEAIEKKLAEMEQAADVRGYIGFRNRVKDLRALLADGGKGEAVKGYAFRCDGRLWVVTDPDVAMRWQSQGFEVTPVTAPQAECAPPTRSLEVIQAVADLNSKLPPLAECAPREAQPVYLVSSEGRFWQIVNEPVWINWQADYRNVLYTAPREAQPDGWKLMPMIPTVEMTVAALAVTDSPCTAYALFLDAAPTPERADAEKDAALTDEAIRRVAVAYYADGSYDDELIGFARAILAANKEPQP